MKRILTDNLIRSTDKFPDRIAFKQLNKSITYGSLLTSSAQLANVLLECGARKGDRIGIFMNRTFESAIAVYGALLAGAAFVPIDTNLPPQRVKQLLDDCNIDILISSPTFQKKIVSLVEEQPPLHTIIGAKELFTQSIKHISWESVWTASSKLPTIQCNESDLAYIIYTSGTTGKSKGIVHTHFSGASYAKLSAELYEITHEDILGNHSHLHYDISTMGYLTMPYVGGCTYIVPEAYTIFPVNLAKLLANEKLTIWYSVPLALIQLINVGDLENKDLDHLRWVLFGGESFSPDYMKKLMKLLPNAMFSNVYGPAEVNQCTYFNFSANEVISNPIPLGQAWPETIVKLVKEHPEDEIGELYVSSSTQMHSYWNKPEKTKEGFITMENTDGEKYRFYKTGDKSKYDNHGNLIFLGRQDRQTKLRGYRIELDELEYIIVKEASVKDAAVYIKKEEEEPFLCASIVVDPSSFSLTTFKKHIAKHLPSHAIPRTIKIVEKLPRTSAGKVNYKAFI